MASVFSFNLPKPTSSFIIRSSSTATASPAISTPESLQDQFGRKGIKFTESNGIPFAELTVRNGSSLKLHIPNAHVTSYKPKLYWKDDGCEEVLYTLPPLPGSASESRGGVGLTVNEDMGSNKSTPLTTSEWVVKDVDSDAIDALQVELSCKSGSLDINYVVSLYPLSMATAVKVQNNGRKPVNLTSAILTHFISKKRMGAGDMGLSIENSATHVKTVNSEAKAVKGVILLLCPWMILTSYSGWTFCCKAGAWCCLA
uniref:Photosynthetic NDH subcomplex B 2 n=1 Tax=Kalanchoe fedtschenkoi TaxID=63787 RepID=A0A7N0TPC6_KALFE